MLTGVRAAAAAPRLLSRLKPGKAMVPFAVIALVALGLRLWELDGRPMHYDESLHVHYSWRLAIGEGYSHSPWMHGPFQVHLTAFIFKIFSDSDFTARLAYALFGTVLVFLPYYLRTYLGRHGAILTSLMLALSPSLLYFSRFGRNDILMVVWAVALLILMWRYINEGRNRYLYMASAVLALAFATKETSYILMAIFGAMLLVLSLTELVPWILGRAKYSELRGAPGFLILLVTLTLPQWAALSSIPLGIFGLELVNEGVGEVGLPLLGAPFVSFPMVKIPLAADLLITIAIFAVPLAIVLFTDQGRRRARLLLPMGAIGALAYAFISFPTGEVARSYLVALGVLAFFLGASIVAGLMWRWRVWLLCAGIFYLTWTFFYTSVFGFFVQHHGYCPTSVGGFFGTLCTRFGGVFTGSWQGLGYWLAQQDVARGGQPWYYHFVIGSVYEFLPLIFGGTAIVYFIKRGNLFGMVLGFWAVATLAVYTVASEKMPWLLVNIAVPYILLSGMFLGDILERVRWRRVLRSPSALLMALAPLLVLGSVYLLHRYLKTGELDSWYESGLVATVVVGAVACVLLLYRPQRRVRFTLAAAGIGVLLLGFSTFGAFRASYSYDDSPVEMLVYAQGSADVVRTVETLGNGVFGDENGERQVDVDYELWYPMNWYVRHEQRSGELGFQCYKGEYEDGYVDWCKPLEEPPSLRGVLLIDTHANRDSTHLEDYEKLGPFKNLLWFPEGYRRPGEDRRRESLMKELSRDFGFVKDIAIQRDAWKGALVYFLFRRLDSEWWNSTYFAYIASGSATETPN